MSPQDPPRSRIRSTVRRVAVDVSPLRVSGDFRWIWFGLLVSQFGYQFTLVASFVQVFRLTDSAAAVGLIGLVGLLSLVIGTLAGSTFLDAVDRRKVLITSQVAFMAASGLLLTGAIHGDPPVGLVYAAVAIIAGVSAIDSPTRSAITPRLVGAELLPSALALNQVVYNSTALVGPAIAGLVIQRYGLAWAYGIDVVSYVAMLAAAVRIHPSPPENAEGATTGWAAVREGFAFLKGRRVLQSTFWIDIVAMVFGMPRALFPILALSQFHRGEGVVGLLFAAPAIGALLGALTTGWVKHVKHQGRAVIWAVVVWGAGIAAFGVVGSNLWLGLLFLALAGAADVISAVFRTTILQLSAPDSMRGRLSSIHILVVTGGPRLGDFEAGLVAQVFSPWASVVSGGLLCIAGVGLVAWIYPELRRYHAGDPG
ncbi:MAG TPA: MFS transporter [Actinomycetota bacterium]|nr:MFS transporter [Actinomycetota bacterium]